MDICLTQGQVTFIDDKHADLAAFNWHARWDRKTFYANRSVRKPDGTRTTVALHQVIAERMGIVGPPDHIDRDGLNNLESNLRPDPNGRNNANQDIRVDNTSGFKGVSWNKARGKWVAQIGIAGKKRHLGLFDDPIEAAKAYDKAAFAAFGEFAFLNFPASDNHISVDPPSDRDVNSIIEE